MELLPIKVSLARDFYAEVCAAIAGMFALRKKIGGMLFQRTALSKHPKAVISSGVASLLPA
jgi:predicted nuclease of restriction endonuclease-like (RecB) superfamily